MHAFVTGGTGLIGRRLVRLLLGRGDRVTVLTRRYAEARQMLSEKCGLVEGDPGEAGPWMDAVAGCDAVVNLAGENLFAKRWNKAFRARMVDSRVRGTANVAEALVRQPRTADGRAKVLVNASAIGIYGPHGDEEVTEDTPPGKDYLADLCVQWEAATRPAEGAGVRCAVVRVGVVLDKDGGALEKMLPPFKLFAGGPVGSGRQWMAWVHHEDIVGIFLLALDNPEARGPLNGTAPNPVTNKEFSRALGRALHRPSFTWTPGFALRLGLGEVAGVVVQGQRVLPKRTEALGYQYKFPTVDGALKQLFPG